MKPTVTVIPLNAPTWEAIDITIYQWPETRRIIQRYIPDAMPDEVTDFIIDVRNQTLTILNRLRIREERREYQIQPSRIIVMAQAIEAIYHPVRQVSTLSF